MTRAILYAVMAVATFAVGAEAATLAADVGAGGYHTCAILMNGRVKCWGHNAFGQLGYNDTTPRGSNPAGMGSALGTIGAFGVGPAVELALGRFHTCVRESTGWVFCWGYNAYGQLGYGSIENLGDEPGEVSLAMGPVIQDAAKISAGVYHTCALKVNGQIACWGYNGYGQLGTGDTLNRRDDPAESYAVPDLGTGRKAVDVLAFGYSTCALLDNQAVKCWGFNNRGQLGQGDILTRGDNPGEMGDSLPIVAAGFGPLRLAGGQYHVCAVTTWQGKCWGSNLYGQLGLGDTTDRGDGPGEMGAALPWVDHHWFGQISGGESHTCFLTYNGGTPYNFRPRCWGRNQFGQLGLGDTDNRGDAPGELGSASPVVNLGTRPDGQPISALRITAGAAHACARLQDGRVKCWGRNDWGQLGVGDAVHRGDNAGEMGDALPGVEL